MLVVAAVTAAATGCADDGPPLSVATPEVVTVEVQRCRQPNRFHGIGVVVGDGLVLTAGHLVEDTLRSLSVGGRPARLVLLDRQRDLAVLAADVVAIDGVPTLGAVPAVASIHRPDGVTPVAINRRVTLEVDAPADRATYVRDVLLFSPTVVEGNSGAPLVDAAGRLVGVVVADRDGEGVAVTGGEVAAVLDEASSADDLSWPDPPGTC